ncbi:VCBS repeat-containing protein [Rhodocytophaga aerolata]|uniref:VCBS repeat-containing protein n=1 Tax=Rhodocytophaga aerolata TaxID=455078 RepID=A0ABT8R4T1_9BACT|nr:VCBS repeat-containing protein [Rhodocytophaga aerolata]MDO1447078.1 VCBS repeat-containing protein [Rhodocytophaga aerolata]
MFRTLLIWAAISIGLLGCQKKAETQEQQNPVEKAATSPPLFTLLPPEKTHVTFSNIIKENPYGNILMYQYFYNGGGVAVGDINNDGLQDIYFTGNMVPNRLYLNKGNMQFEDITEKAGVAGRKNNWKTGVTMADVNGDQLLDMYVCYSGNMPGEARVNQLFINQGTDAAGLPQFTDMASHYGLADSSFSTQSSFFDYDRDNDLDMFLLNHNPELFRNLDDISITEKLKQKESSIRVKLFRNENGKFADVSDKAGFFGSAFTYGLGVAIADINTDGWPDMYISNDYSAPDYLYINNGDGTFTDQLKQSMGHTPLYSMGNDISDINNDALPDVFTLDMLPEDNRRQKLLFAPDNYEHFDLFLRVGFHYQYMRNMLHINNGNGTFSEIGQLAGISNTDWSWAPLFADYDNDGWKDLFVSNGFLRDFTNMDFIKFRSSFYQSGQVDPEGVLALVNKIPSSQVNNYIFKNNGNLTFSNQGKAWGINIPSNSNGAAYADLDNDGDLDLITNNINQQAFIYQNQANTQLSKNNYLQLKLEGEGKNTAGFGAKVVLFIDGKKQYQEQMPSRGFQSSVSPVLHVGLGENTLIDSLQIIWLSGKQQLLRNIQPNQLLSLQEKNATSTYRFPATTSPILAEIKSPISFTHQLTPVNDFKRQPLMVNPLSFPGPCLAKSDVNKDGLEDVFVGGSRGQAGRVYLQAKNGKFIPTPIPALETDKLSNDADALFLDVNQDTYPDLYIVSGGYDTYLPNDSLLQDRLYLNDGKGNFTRDKQALPAMLESKSCVRATDVNKDGYPDLFVGGRVIPGRYPETPQSYLLINNGKGQFMDMTAELAPQLQKLGMVTDAAWHDLNGDMQAELIVVGEWMPVTVFANTNGKFTNATQTYFDKNYRGWWNSLQIDDFNGDGKSDLIVGNLGLNSQCKASDTEPAELYYKDFDDNGSVDPILCFYIQGKSYPYVTRDELLDQVSSMRTRFADYTSYASATLTDIFTPQEMKGAGHLTANQLQTTLFITNAQGKFEEKPLPIEAQFAPVHTLISFDYNQDGKKDLLLAGNIQHSRLRFGKYDASYGTLLQGNGNGQFSYVPQGNSGLKLSGDVRSSIMLGNSILFGINGEQVKAYQVKGIK